MTKIKGTCIGVNGEVKDLYFNLKDITRFGQSEDGVEAICKVGFEDKFAVILSARGSQDKKELPINMAGTFWLNAHGLSKIIHGNLLVLGMIPKATSFSDCPDEVALQVPLLREEGSNFKMMNCNGLDSEEIIDEIIEAVNGILGLDLDETEGDY